MILMGRQRHRGSVLALVLMMVVLVTLELLMLAVIVTRGLGEEGVLMSQNISAQHASQIALRRISDDLYTYLRNNNSDLSSVDTDFAYSTGSGTFTDEVLTATDPEDGSTDNTNITISGWLADRRGHYFKLAGQAKIGSVDLTAYRWVLMNPCAPTVLQTLVSGRDLDQGASTVVDPNTGRVYFGEQDDPGNYYTWHLSTGLSTLVTGLAAPGNDLSAVDPITGRVYFGSYNDENFSFLPSTGLSTIGSYGSEGDGGYTGYSAPSNVYSHATDGRVYFLNLFDDVMTWSSATGLSTLVRVSKCCGLETLIGVDTSTGRAYMGDMADPGEFYTWHPSTGLSTIADSLDNPGRGSMAVLSDAANSQVAFGEYDSSGNFYTWSVTGGLTTIIDSRPNPGHGSISTAAIDSSHRVYFGEYSHPGFFYTWHSATGLSTLAETNSGAFDGIVKNPSSDRIYFGSLGSPTCCSVEDFYTYTLATGLQTLTSTTGIMLHGGEGTATFNSSFDKAYFNTAWNEDVYEYDENTQTLSSAYDPSHSSSKMAYDSSTDRILAVGHDNPGEVYLWNASTGLSIIFSNLDNNGAGHGDAAAGNGYYYFTDGADPGNVYAWYENTCNSF